MKRKLILACVTLLMMGSVVTTHAVTASEEEVPTDEIGDDDSLYGGKCEAPLTNTCYKIYKAGVLIGTKKGILIVS